MDFKEATDRLFSQIDHDNLAAELKVSVALIRQARLRSEAHGHRAPPKQWEKAVLNLAERQIEHYQRLAVALRKSAARVNGTTHSIRGRPITS